MSTVVCGSNHLNSDTYPCPNCHELGKMVKAETLKNMLNDDLLPNSLESFSLCLSKACDVAYFGQQVFYKDDIKVKIWFKENDQFVPICYCKGVTEADIIEHIAIRGC